MKKIVLLFVVLMTVVFLSVLHPENTVKARDDRPVEKTTEEIVKEIRRTGTSVTLQEDGSEIEFEYDPFALEYAKDEDIAKWVEERRNKVPAEISINADKGMSADNPFTSVEEAGAYCKPLMKNHQESISFYAKGQFAYADVRWAASEYIEGVTPGTEGDAIRWMTANSSTLRKEVSTGVYLHTFTIGYRTTYSQDTTLTTLVNNAISSMKLDSMSIPLKIQTIYNYICDHVDYDFDHVGDAENYPLIYTAYGAILNGKAVCLGNAMLFYRICRDIGLDCRTISGHTEKGGYHAWNIVRYNGKYYNIDTTWDGEYSGTYHKYFMRCEANFPDHNREEPYSDASFYADFPMTSQDYLERPSLTCRTYDCSGVVHLNWNSIPNAVDYTVMRVEEDGSWSVLQKNITNLYYSDTTAEPGKKHEYRVCAYDKDKVWGYWGNIVSATPTVVPLQVSGTVLTNGHPKLSWTQMDSAYKYYIYRMDPDGYGYGQIAVSTGSSYTDETAVPGNTYSYKIRPVDLSGNLGPESAAVDLDAFTCYPNPVITLTQDGGAAELTWDSVPYATKYIVYRSTEESFAGSEIAVLGKVNQYTDMSVPLSGTYYYRMRAVSANGSQSVLTAARSIYVTVIAPTITAQPSSKTVTAGTAVNFKVAASGTALKYQWYYRTSSNGTWMKSTADCALTDTYKLTAAQVTSARNGYQYKCVVSNGAGSKTSGIVTLTVSSVAKPTITAQPKSQTAASGTAVNFKVTASGSGLKYQWYYRTSSSGTWAKSTAACATTNTYKLTASQVVSARNGYQYKCEVSNSGGKVTSNTVTLTVVTKPKITAQPSSKTVSAGNAVEFKVTASGGGLKYQWYYRTSSSGTWMKSTAACATTNTYKLTASQVVKARSGYQYKCVITNAAGTVTSNIVTLTVK
ncbi:MAG: hypothetical protein IIU06_09300 [Erysipelotrichales bacterium]|nr:hypothetical protein [Erysipelotrichales bacterium]